MGEFNEASNLSNNFEKKDNLDFLKKAILENPKRFIEGAIEKVLDDKITLGKDLPKEDECIAEVLKYLFPTKEIYWNDKELKNEVRKILIEKNISLQTNGSKIVRFTGSSNKHLEDWEKRREAEEIDG